MDIRFRRGNRPLVWQSERQRRRERWMSAVCLTFRASNHLKGIGTLARLPVQRLQFRI